MPENQSLDKKVSKDGRKFSFYLGNRVEYFEDDKFGEYYFCNGEWLYCVS